ncbi:MAG: hypothetical protein Q8P05_00005 [Candidatus Diapherotrites archaeon]|nr:hypothetical protein [Candidatus Diapherotrites archaeon]
MANILYSPDPSKKKKKGSSSSIRQKVEREALRDMYPPSKPRKPIKKL